MIDTTGDTGHRNSLNELQWRKLAGRRLSPQGPGTAQRYGSDCGKNQSKRYVRLSHIFLLTELACIAGNHAQRFDRIRDSSIHSFWHPLYLSCERLEEPGKPIDSPCQRLLS